IVCGAVDDEMEEAWLDLDSDAIDGSQVIDITCNLHVLRLLLSENSLLRASSGVRHATWTGEYQRIYVSVLLSFIHMTDFLQRAGWGNSFCSSTHSGVRTASFVTGGYWNVSMSAIKSEVAQEPDTMMKIASCVHGS
ncbi:hypothetical protein EV421DRAFT_1748527, partial [Armillaria borealis]